MPVCKFFLEGYCRYGSRCRFIHPENGGRENYDYGDNYYGYDDHRYNRNQHQQRQQPTSKAFSGVSILRADRSNNNPSFTPIQDQVSNYNTGPRYQNSNFNPTSNFSSYSSSNYNPNPNNGNNQHSSPPSQLVQDLYTAIVKELETSENGHQWPLSCCCPIIREPVNIPGWIDHSPEELRWEVYKASKDGTFDQCKASIQVLFQEAQERRNDFKLKDKAFAVIESMLEIKRNGGNTFSNTDDSNTYVNQNSGFGGSSNVSAPLSSFGVTQTQAQPFTPGFGSVEPVPGVVSAPPAKFFQDPAPAFSFSLNQNPAATNANNTIATSAIAPPPQMFNNNLFLQNSQLTCHNTSSATSQISENNLGNFSGISELSENERTAFETGRFTFGKVPMKPPPQELC